MNPILLFHLKCGIDLSVGDEAGYLGKGAGGVRDDSRPVVSAVGPGEHALPELDILAHLHSLIVLHMVHCNLCLTHKLEAGLRLLREIFININIYIYYRTLSRYKD